MTAKYGEKCGLLRKSFYVGDLIMSVASRHEAEKIIAIAEEIMRLANFNLRKWNTSDARIRQTFLINDKELPIEQKVLGVKWCTASDVISVDLKNTLNLVQHSLLE